MDYFKESKTERVFGGLQKKFRDSLNGLSRFDYTTDYVYYGKGPTCYSEKKNDD